MKDEESVYEISKPEMTYGGIVTSTDPILYWYTEEGSKRGKRNLMWDICKELYQEYEDIRAERVKLRNLINSGKFE